MGIRCKACRQIKSAEEDLKTAQKVMIEQSEKLVHVKKQVEDLHSRMRAQKQQVNVAFKELNVTHTKLGHKSMSVIELRDFVKNIKSEALKKGNRDLVSECEIVLGRYK